VLRFFGPIETNAQRVFAYSLVTQAEVKVAASLAPAFEIASALSMGARAGLFNSLSYTALTNVVSPYLLASAAVQFVHVVGATEKAVIFRPGSIRTNPWNILHGSQ